MLEPAACTRCHTAQAVVKELQSCLNQVVTSYDREIKRCVRASPLCHPTRAANDASMMQADQGPGTGASAQRRERDSGRRDKCIRDHLVRQHSRLRGGDEAPGGLLHAWHGRAPAGH